MAQDAELRLKVSLDLAFFRQQLAGLGQVSAGYKMPVQVHFDRRSIQNELNALGANIRRRNYSLEVKTNLEAETRKAKNLADALRSLESGKGVGRVSGGTFRQELGKVDLATIRNVYAAAAKAGLLTFNEETTRNKGALITALKQAADDAGEGFLRAFQKENSRVRKAAGDYGDSLLGGLKKSLKISSPSWEMKKLGEYAADGFEIGLSKGLQEAQDSAVNAMRRMIAALRGEASKFGPALTMAFAGGGTGGMREALLMASGMAGLIRPETYGQRMNRQGRESIAARYGASPAMPYLGGQAPFRYSMGGGAVAGLLGPAGSTGGGVISREAYFAQRQLQAQARSAARSEQVMRNDRMAAVVSGQVPLGGGGPFLPPGGPPGGGGGLFGGAGGFGRAIGTLNLPGTGTIKELGTEFAFATKQVLLFGTAYKALAFIQAFPGEVGQAVGQLQSFRNTLGAISPTAKEAAASNQLILDLVDRYNIPLQSARDGFTKLYASMAPAGFNGDEIRSLFTGISQAAATFGMSADKVDRVNYAFAQMASKGQVMSEELKGQLGDVLPGAMAIFAEAAGFKGPKAIQDFSAALEDGQYKGQAMVALLKNVGVVMTQEFGPGAEGAARTFQGSINRMQNSLKLLYESFEPVAVGFLNGVVTPLTQGIKQVADGMNAFMSGAQAKTAGGFALAKELERLKPAFDGIKANVSGVIQQLGAFAKIALDVSKVLLQIAGNPVVGYLLKLYAIFLPLNLALNVMRGLWISNAAQLLIFNARVLAGTSTLTAFRGMMAATGNTAQVTAASIRAAGLTLRTFFASTGVGLVLVGISALIERFMSLNQRLEETKLKAIGAAQAIRGMSASEARSEEFSRARVVKILQGLQKQQTPYGGQPEVTPNQVQQLEAAGVPVEGGLVPGGRRFISREKLSGLIQQQMQLAGEAKYRQKQLRFEEQQLTTPPALGAIPPGEGDTGTGTKLQPYDRSQLQVIQQIFDKNKQILDVKLLEDKISKTAYGVALANLTAVKEKAEAEEGYRLEVLKANRDNMSASDKELRLFDLKKAKTDELLNIEERRKFAIKKATEEIRSPFKDALRDVNIEIDSQEMQISNLRAGYNGLTSEQEAQLLIQQQTKNLRADEYRAIQDSIGALQEQLRIRIENNKLIEQERNLAAVRARISGAGGGLMAGFYGSAAQTYERSLIESNGNVNYAQQMAQLESQAMQLESVFGSIQNAIGGIGDAFGTMMTQGIAQLIQGTATAQEVFSSFLKAVGDALLQAASQMIATYIAIGIAKAFAGLGGGSGAKPDAVANFNAGVAAYGLAKGGYLSGGFQAFADGGMVTGPTLGLIGEGGEPEYVIPQSKMRGAMERYAAGTRGASVIPSSADGAGGEAMAAMMGPIDVRYQVERINSVDYVTADQFQVGLAQAAKQGAAQGEQRTLRRLQMSASTRRRVGI